MVFEVPAIQTGAVSCWSSKRRVTKFFKMALAKIFCRQQKEEKIQFNTE